MSPNESEGTKLDLGLLACRASDDQNDLLGVVHKNLYVMYRYFIHIWWQGWNVVSLFDTWGGTHGKESDTKVILMLRKKLFYFVCKSIK